MFLKKGIWVVYWIIGVFTLSAQTVSNSTAYKATVHQFTTNDGLSHNAINGVYQDSRNLYWTTTRHGLNRFDGHHFKQYTKEKNGLHSNILDAIYEDKGLNSRNTTTLDKTGMIWVLTGEGNSDEWFVGKNTFHYSIFNPYTEQVIEPEEYLGSELYNHLKNLVGYRVLENHLLLLTKTGYVIKYYHRSKVEITQLKKPVENFFFYKQLSNQKHWVGSIEGTYKHLQLHSEDQQFIKNQQFCSFGHGCDNPQECIGDIHITPTNNKNDSLWFSSTESNSKLNALFCLLPSGEIISIPYHSLLPHLRKDQVLDVIYYDADDQLFWLSDRERKTYIVHLENKLVFTLDFPLENIWLKDDQKLFWASNNNGLQVIQFNKRPFQKRLEGFGVRGIAIDDKKRIWAYPNHIEGTNPTTDNQSFNYTSILAGHGLLKDKEETIWSFCIQDNQLWLGSFGKENGSKAVLMPVNLPSSSIWSIYKNTPTNLFWGGGEKGLLFSYDPKSQKTMLFQKFNSFDAFKEATIYQIKPDGDQGFWLATSNGLYLMDKSKGIIARYWNEGKNEFYLPFDAIHHIYIDEENTFWLGSRSSGLFQLEMTNGQLRMVNQFTISDGLPSNGIHAVYEDDYGYLWLNTENKIAQFHKTTHFSSHYSMKDGIVHPEGNRISHYQDEDGRLYFGTIEGITAFHPKDFLQQTNVQNKYIHLIGFEQYSASKQDMENRIAQFKESEKIVLPSKEGRVELTLSEPFTIGVKNIFYSYQIKGLHAKPNSLFQPKITISDVPFGKYSLELSAYNSKGDLLDRQNIPLISVPPYYLQWWFLALLVLVGGVLSYLFIQYRTRALVHQKTMLETEVRQRTKQLEADKAIIEQQAEELKQLNETKSRFFANVSHELRTPIQLIQGPIQSILNMETLSNKELTLLLKAERSSGRLMRLVDEILDLTKLDAKKLMLHEEKVVPYTFLRRIISNFQSIADAKSIHFTFVYYLKETVQIELDADKFEKIINNLLTNAFKFTPKGGKVRVSIENKNNNLLLKIKDNGRGIPEADVPFIFDRFYQSSTNKKAEGGLGVGLALSMEFVKLMKGKMWVKSSTEIPNQGSEFYFQFLKKEVMTMLSTEDQLEISAVEATPSSNSKTIIKDDSSDISIPHQTLLIVEDNHDLREYLQFLLAPHYKIIMAENGQEALELLMPPSLDHEPSFDPDLTTDETKQSQNEVLLNRQSSSTVSVRRQVQYPSLIISDVMMPVMDGFEFLENVKANDALRNIPFVMLTARAELKDKLKALRIGVDDYLIKPFKEEELLARIENLLANAKERNDFIQAQTVLSSKTKDIPETISNNSTVENIWLEQVEHLVLKHLTDNRFSVDYLAELLAINRKTLYQKIKSLTGLTPNQYIRTIRLQRAKERLEKGEYTSVKAAANDVGFLRPDYFSKLYIKAFGKAPIDYF